jgi:putative endonuclease
MIATVYVLRSLRTGKRYVGCTQKAVEQRLIEHNSGANKWTRSNKPLKIIYTEQFETLQEARAREYFLKSGQGRRWLDQNIPR